MGEGGQHSLGQGSPPHSGEMNLGVSLVGQGEGYCSRAPTTPPAKAKMREGWGVGRKLGAVGAQRLLQGRVGSGWCLGRSWLSPVIGSLEMGTRHQSWGKDG